jgi:hypothetical protein
MSFRDLYANASYMMRDYGSADACPMPVNCAVPKSMLGKSTLLHIPMAGHRVPAVLPDVPRVSHKKQVTVLPDVPRVSHKKKVVVPITMATSEILVHRPIKKIQKQHSSTRTLGSMFLAPKKTVVCAEFWGGMLDIMGPITRVAQRQEVLVLDHILHTWFPCGEGVDDLEIQAHRARYVNEGMCLFIDDFCGRLDIKIPESLQCASVRKEKVIQLWDGVIALLLSGTDDHYLYHALTSTISEAYYNNGYPSICAYFVTPVLVCLSMGFGMMETTSFSGRFGSCVVDNSSCSLTRQYIDVSFSHSVHRN